MARCLRLCLCLCLSVQQRDRPQSLRWAPAPRSRAPDLSCTCASDRRQRARDHGRWSHWRASGPGRLARSPPSLAQPPPPHPPPLPPRSRPTMHPCTLPRRAPPHRVPFRGRHAEPQPRHSRLDSTELRPAARSTAPTCACPILLPLRYSPGRRASLSFQALKCAASGLCGVSQ